MLEIKNLRAKAGNNEILRGIDLKVNVGEVHAIIGPNGLGKRSASGGVTATRPASTPSSTCVSYAHARYAPGK